MLRCCCRRVYAPLVLHVIVAASYFGCWSCVACGGAFRLCACVARFVLDISFCFRGSHVARSIVLFEYIMKQTFWNPTIAILESRLRDCPLMFRNVVLFARKAV